MKPQADWSAVDSPKNEPKNVFFFFFTLHSKKTNLFVCFLEETTARKSAYGFI